MSAAVLYVLGALLQFINGEPWRSVRSRWLLAPVWPVLVPLTLLICWTPRRWWPKSPEPQPWGRSDLVADFKNGNHSKS